MLAHRRPVDGPASLPSSVVPPCYPASWLSSPHSENPHPPPLRVCPWGLGGSQEGARSLGRSEHPSKREQVLLGTVPHGASHPAGRYQAPVPQCRSQGQSSPRLGCPSGSWAYSPSLSYPHGALPGGGPGLHRPGAVWAAVVQAGAGHSLPMGRLRGVLPLSAQRARALFPPGRRGRSRAAGWRGRTPGFAGCGTRRGWAAPASGPRL